MPVASNFFSIDGGKLASQTFVATVANMSDDTFRRGRFLKAACSAEQERVSWTELEESFCEAVDDRQEEAPAAGIAANSALSLFAEVCVFTTGLI